MFWVKILSHIYPKFFICTVPFKFNLTSCIIFCMIILYRDLLYYIVFYILYYLYLGGFHASDSLSLNGSHPDMLFNLYFFSVICRINIFLLLLLTTIQRRIDVDVEIRLKSCCNCGEITLKLWRWNKFHMKPIFNVVSTSVCYFSTSFQHWNNVVVPAGKWVLYQANRVITYIKSTNMLKICCTVFTDFAKIDYVDRYW